MERVAYFDEFEETQRSIAHIKESDSIRVHYSGNEIVVDFRKFPGPVALLLKHSFVRLLSPGSSQGTAASYLNFVSYLAPGEVEELALASPQTIASLWSRLLARDYPLNFDPALIKDYLDCFKSDASKAEVMDELESHYEDMDPEKRKARLEIMGLIANPQVFFDEFEDDSEYVADGSAADEW
ncbi:hypothetical protein [Dyella japonica]|uniref:Uncharacterized protein n=1 Tax=Dyella japonica A8 TaxID=1217721 RepID=A0A075K1B9_9GAMM|nr:hypothetical protein [Dyella japonica]AIF48141.1 hypothetical protein HY57_13165 [Dyella japonica A8]